LLAGQRREPAVRGRLNTKQILNLGSEVGDGFLTTRTPSEMTYSSWQIMREHQTSAQRPKQVDAEKISAAPSETWIGETE
jgi:hypothetical protein